MKICLTASNPDPQICPMEGLYTLRGAIGPPYMTSRHKRNHNNRFHGLTHSRLHHQQQEMGEMQFNGGSHNSNNHFKYLLLIVIT